MKNIFLKFLYLALGIIAMVTFIMVVFRSDHPMIWIAAFIICLILAIKFPYRKYFGNQNSKL